MRRRWLALALVGVAGCGGRTPLGVGSSEEPMPPAGGAGMQLPPGPTGEVPVDDHRPSPSDAKQFCGQPGDSLDTPNVESLKAHLVGDWIYCAGPNLYLLQHDGIEFTLDGHWYFLHLDNVGGFVRGRGFDGEGTWVLVADNGPGSYQLDLQLEGSGTNPIYPVFEKNPIAMRIKWMLGATDYVGASQR